MGVLYILINISCLNEGSGVMVKFGNDRVFISQMAFQCFPSTSRAQLPCLQLCFFLEFALWFFPEVLWFSLKYYGLSLKYYDCAVEG